MHRLCQRAEFQRFLCAQYFLPGSSRHLAVHSEFVFLRKVCGMEMSHFGGFPSVLWSEFLKSTSEKSFEVITSISDRDYAISVASSLSRDAIQNF